jgi:hypothetical protein
MARILTTRQFQALYQIGEKAARRLLYSGEIAGIKTGAGWRILDPGPVLLEMVRRQSQELAAVPFIRGLEASQLTGISDRRLRQLAEAGEIEFKLSGKRRVYALQSLLDFMARRGQNRDKHDGYRRPYVMAWARDLVERKLPDYCSGNDLPESRQATPSRSASNQCEKQS